MKRVLLLVSHFLHLLPGLRGFLHHVKRPKVVQDPDIDGSKVDRPTAASLSRDADLV